MYFHHLCRSVLIIRSSIGAQSPGGRRRLSSHQPVCSSWSSRRWGSFPLFQQLTAGVGPADARWCCLCPPEVLAPLLWRDSPPHILTAPHRQQTERRPGFLRQACNLHPSRNSPSTGGRFMKSCSLGGSVSCSSFSNNNLHIGATPQGRGAHLFVRAAAAPPQAGAARKGVDPAATAQ